MDFGKMFGNRYMRYMVQKLLDTLIEKSEREFEYKFYDEDRLANKVI